MEALFLEHEGYFGALGAFLLSQSIPHQETNNKKKYQSQQPTAVPDVEVDPNRPGLRRRQTVESNSGLSGPS